MTARRRRETTLERVEKYVVLTLLAVVILAVLAWLYTKLKFGTVDTTPLRDSVVTRESQSGKPTATEQSGNPTAAKQYGNPTAAERIAKLQFALEAADKDKISAQQIAKTAQKNVEALTYKYETPRWRKAADWAADNKYKIVGTGATLGAAGAGYYYYDPETATWVATKAVDGLKAVPDGAKYVWDNSGKWYENAKGYLGRLGRAAANQPDPPTMVENSTTQRVMGGVVPGVGLSALGLGVAGVTGPVALPIVALGGAYGWLSNKYK